MITNEDIARIPKDAVSNHDPVFMAGITRFIDHYRNRETFKVDFDHIEKCIHELLCWKFISYPAESELIEAIIRNAECRNVLEVGMYTGFSTLHMIRAVLPLKGRVTGISIFKEWKPDHFGQFERSGVFRFVHGRTPEIIQSLYGEVFDLVFVDSDHTPEHTESELSELLKVTKQGSIFLFHDLPRVQHPGAPKETEIRQWINGVVRRGTLVGCVLPSCFRVDIAIACGRVDYDRGVNPHMGVFVRP